jgi:hypothetical protein
VIAYTCKYWNISVVSAVFIDIFQHNQQYDTLLPVTPRVRKLNGGIAYWVHSANWKKVDDETEGKKAVWTFLLKERPEYIPMKPEDNARIRRQEFENLIKDTNDPEYLTQMFHVSVNQTYQLRHNH